MIGTSIMRTDMDTSTAMPVIKEKIWTVSVSVLDSFSSTAPMSFENRFNIWPGVIKPIRYISIRNAEVQVLTRWIFVEKAHGRVNEVLEHRPVQTNAGLHTHPYY